MKSARFHVGAEEELHEVWRYYESKQPGLGKQWTESVAEATRQIQRKPGIGRPARFGTRKLRLSCFPYYVIFIAQNTHVLIVSFMHVKRGGDYWVTRL